MKAHTRRISSAFNRRDDSDDGGIVVDKSGLKHSCRFSGAGWSTPRPRWSNAIGRISSQRKLLAVWVKSKHLPGSVCVRVFVWFTWSSSPSSSLVEKFIQLKNTCRNHVASYSFHDNRFPQRRAMKASAASTVWCQFFLVKSSFVWRQCRPWYYSNQFRPKFEYSSCWGLRFV